MTVIDASEEFKGKSQGGLYGDAIEELDYHTGRLLDALDDLGLRDDTIVIFTSDNGTWNNFQESLRPRHNGAIAWGSSGPLREGKGSTYEGGSRVPCIIRWPGKVSAGRVSDSIFSTLDFLPTFGMLAGYNPPDNYVIDGVDQTELLLGRSEVGNRDTYFFFCQNELHGVRKGPWKLILSNRKNFYDYVKDRGSDGIELYNLQDDISESRNVADEHPEVVEELLTLSQSFDWPEKIIEFTIGLPSE